jgi:hypothetical protein
MNTTTAEPGNFTQEYYYEDEWELKPFVKVSTSNVTINKV